MGLVGVAVALAFSAILVRVYYTNNLMFQSNEAFFRFNVIFGSDIPRVIDDLTNIWANHYRSKVHPLFVYFFLPLGSRMTESLGAAPIAAALMTAVVGGLCNFLFYLYARLLHCSIVESLLLTVAFAFSTAQLVWSSVSETFVFGSATLLVIHLVTVYIMERKKLKPLPTAIALIALPISGIGALAVTTTNYLQAVVCFASAIVTVVGRMKKRQTHIRIGLAGLGIAACIAISLFLSIRLADRQKELYPSTIQFYKSEAYNEESRYTTWDNLKQPIQTSRTLALNFGLYSIIPPLPSVLPASEPPDTLSIVFVDDSWKTYDKVAVAGLVCWVLLALHGIGRGLVARERRPMLVLIVSCLVINVGIHSVYGTTECFMYSPHLAFLTFALVALGLGELSRGGSRSHRALSIISLAILCGVSVFRNTDFIQRLDLILSTL